MKSDNCIDGSPWLPASSIALVHPVLLYTQGFLTIFMNILFCVSVLSSKPLRVHSYYLLVSNSLADICTGLYLLPLPGTRWLAESRDQPLVLPLCITLLTAGSYFNAVSVAHWATIAGERLLRFYHETIHERWASKRLVLAMITCWTLPGLLTYVRRLVPYFSGTYPYDLNSSSQDVCYHLTKVRCEFGHCASKKWAVLSMFLKYFLPLAIAVCCYGYMMMRAKRRIDALVQSELELAAVGVRKHVNPCSTLNSWKKLWMSPEVQYIGLYVVIVLAFTACTLQYYVGRVAFIFDDDEKMVSPNDCGTPGDNDFFIANVWSRGTRLNMREIVAYLNALVNPMLLFALKHDFAKSCVNFITRSNRYDMKDPSRPENHGLAASFEKASSIELRVRSRWSADEVRTGSTLYENHAGIILTRPTSPTKN